MASLTAWERPKADAQSPRLNLREKHRLSEGTLGNTEGVGGVLRCVPGHRSTHLRHRQNHSDGEGLGSNKTQDPRAGRLEGLD